MLRVWLRSSSSLLSLTEGNYTTAWTMLQDRYNNMRILASTLLEKLTGQPQLPPENTSAVAIRNLYNTTQETILALNNLGVGTNTWYPINLHIILTNWTRDFTCYMTNFWQVQGKFHHYTNS